MVPFCIVVFVVTPSFERICSSGTSLKLMPGTLAAWTQNQALLFCALQGPLEHLL